MLENNPGLPAISQKSEQVHQSNKKHSTKSQPTKKTPRKLPLFLKITFPLVGLVIINLIYQNFSAIVETQNLYRLKTIEFEGINIADPNQLVAELGLKKDTNLLYLNQGRLREIIRKIPRFKTAEVKIEHPDTLFIRVEEKKPSFLIRMGRELATTTENLELVAIGAHIKNYDLFTIEIPTVDNFDSARHHPSIVKFLEIYKQLPLKEKDVLKLFSGIRLGTGKLAKSELYLNRVRKDGLKIGLFELSLDTMRRARYAYLYVKKQNTRIAEINIKRDWVVMKKSQIKS